ncbi:MAG TPA: PAS domain-containing sensor histidine kinase [Caulobacteraceae bacterium]|nr:PAS domain-containing sensor histidine kinase [Caulobacteraceae bacterium]
MESDAALSYPASPALGRGWLSGLEARPLLWTGYALSATLTAAAVGLGSSPSLSGPLGPASPLVLSLLGFNFLLILALGVLIGRRVLHLAGRQTGDAGARLHLRFVALFAAAAVLPALIVAFFFGALVTRGVDNWFNARVGTVMENSAKVANSYIDEQKNYLSDHIRLVARDLNGAGPAALTDAPIAFSQYLAGVAADNGFAAAYVLDGEGRVIAKSERPDGPAFLEPPTATFTDADTGGDEVEARPFEHTDVLRALYRLRSFPNAYLYVVRPVEKGVFKHLRETEASLAEYRQARASRTAIQFGFFLVYLEVVLVVLLGAVSFGMAAASSIAAPLARLVQAAGRVATGDLGVRVETGEGLEEIAGLFRAFNNMTRDLEAQQNALVSAHKEAESRRQFVETMLFGVSAGVIGLDSAGRISVVNRQAASLLELPGARQGRPLRELAPEFGDAVQRAGETAGPLEEDVDVVRGGESRRLRLRIGHSPDGLVLTFDDITRLVAAQRNAAWKDVARRIAHEIKNPLTPIQLSAERLRRKYRGELTGDLETFDRCTDTIIRQVGDIGRMVDEFSAFARMPAPKFAASDGAELLRQAAFAQRVADPETQVDVVLPAGETRLFCDARMIGQALTNLLKNAGEAIAARRLVAPEPPGRITARLVTTPGWATFEIEDNGVGLPAKDRDRLTEPYVTTREKGTGLGLAIVDRIMEEHGGELGLSDAAHPPGARVTLRLPIAPDLAAGAAAEPASTAASAPAESLKDA